MKNLNLVAINSQSLKLIIKENPEMLKNSEMKKRVISGADQSIFLEFIPKEISLDAFKMLFDEEGISILEQDFFVENILKNLMTISPNQVIEYLFEQFSFCRIVQKHIENIRICFQNSITEKCTILFMKYIFEQEPEAAKKIFFFTINEKYQLPIVKALPIPFELVRSILTTDSAIHYNYDVVKYLVEETSLINSLVDFTIEEVFTILDNTENLPQYLLNEDSFVRKIAFMDSVKNYRLLIEKMRMNYDVSLIEAARKRYYDKEISSFMIEENMLSRYFSFYQELCEHTKNGFKNVDFINNLIDKYFVFSEKRNRNVFHKDIHGIEFRSRVVATYYAHSLRSFLEKESHRQLTNMVIDYHYEDIPYNLFLDLGQLLHFQIEGEKTLSDKEIEFYSRLLDMDTMSYEELKELHERLKKYPAKENLYDDFRTAKDRAIILMNHSVLNKESIQKYKDNVLTEKYGVDVYVLDGDDFFAYIRGYEIFKTDTLMKNPVRQDIDRNSYSLVGTSQLGTFLNPKQSFNFIYLTPMPVNQVAHVCSGPSYSISYERNVTEASPWLYEICTPESLLDTKDEYTEIVVNVPNSERNDELNSKLIHPEIFGIFCYDEIMDVDVDSAKYMGKSIVLVKTESYEKKKSKLPRRSIKYINQIDEDDMDKRRKK